MMNNISQNGNLFTENPNFKKVKGLNFIERKFIDIDDILVDPQNNDARFGGIDRSNVDNLKYSFSSGIRYNEPLPVLEKLHISKKYDDGKVKFFALIDGFNRINALKELGVTKYWFDIIEFDSSKCDVFLAKTSFALLSNAHPPRAPSNDKDIINAVSKLVFEGKINNDELDILDYIKKYTQQKPANARKLANMVAARTDAKAASIFVWSTAMIKHDTYTLGISSHGKVDPNNGMHGWTCLEDYEDDTIMNTIAKYYETGRKSYVVGHTKLPESLSNLEDRRAQMKKTFEHKFEQLAKFYEYYKENGHFPVEFIGFLPQTDEEDRKKIVK